MKHKITLALVTLSVINLVAQSDAQLLGSAGKFAVLAGSTVTSTGATVLNCDLGLWPGTAITGFGPGIVNGTYHIADAVAQQAQEDVTTAYDALVAEAYTQDLTGEDLGARTLFAGVYRFSSSAQLTGVLVLDARGDSNARFDFQIGSTLTSASNARVQMINGGDGCNLYWQVGSSATLGTGTALTGHILAMASITMTTGATITDGSALARNGAVTLDANTITACPVPEPTSFAVISAGLLLISRRKRN